MQSTCGLMRSRGSVISRGALVTAPAVVRMACSPSSRARTEVARYLAVVAELDPATKLPDGLADRVRVLVASGQDKAAGSLIPDAVLDRFAFSGTPEHVAALAERVLEAGADRVDFGTPHGLTDDKGVALLGTAVLPRLRQRGG